MSMPTPRESILRTIRRWEGVYGNQAWDPGNWVTMPNGTRQLLGTKFGVTPAALAAHRGKQPWQMTVADMKAMPIEEAGDIGEMMFYRGTGIDQLPWGPATDVLMDIGWGTGVPQAVKLMQRLVGVNADGRIGPLTIEAYKRWVAKIGWEQAVRELHRVRMDFYRLLGRQDPVHFGPPQPGWKNRADWMTPEGMPSYKPGEWWADWKDNIPPLPVAAEIAPKPAPADKQAPVAPPPKPSTVDKTLGTVAAGAAAATPIVTPLFGADWKVVVAIVAGLIVAGIAGLVVWRLHQRDKREAAT